jgi:hypothetical protein
MYFSRDPKPVGEAHNFDPRPLRQPQHHGKLHWLTLAALGWCGGHFRTQIARTATVHAQPID